MPAPACAQLGNKLARESGGKPGHYHVLLSHVHWDHIQGLPFFSPAYIPGTKISVYALLTAADELNQVIGGITRHEFFPMPLEAVPAQFEFHQVEPGVDFVIGDFHVTPIALNHPFGSVGYRIDADGSSWAYVADTAPFDQVLHKQHFLSGPEPLSDRRSQPRSTRCARRSCAARRASTPSSTTRTSCPTSTRGFRTTGTRRRIRRSRSAPRRSVRRLVLYHHAPSHGDDQMDRIAADYLAKGAAIGIEVLTSFEGMTLPIGAGGGRSEDPLLGRARLVRDVRARVPALWRQHDVDRARDRRRPAPARSTSAPARPSSRSN